VIYSITFISIGVCYFFLLRRGYSRLAWFSISLFLSLFAALRADWVDQDYLVYKSWYETRANADGLTERPFFFEALYFAANNAFSKLSVPFRFFIWLIAFTSILIKIYTLKQFAHKQSGFIAGFIFYLFSYYLLHEMTQIRVGLALGFIALAFFNLNKNKFREFWLLILLATLFHSSALLAIVARFLLGSRIRFIDFFLICLITATVGLRLYDVSVLVLATEHLAKLDPRLELYFEQGLLGLRDPSNPFPVTSFMLLCTVLATYALTLRSQYFLHKTPINDSLLFFTRLLALSIPPLHLFTEAQEISLRVSEFYASNIPLFAVVLFSRNGFGIAKIFILSWLLLVIHIYVFRVDPLVEAYSTFYFH
jgi:hypothetical protein